MFFISTLSGPRSIVMAMSELRKALFPLSNIVSISLYFCNWLRTVEEFR